MQKLYVGGLPYSIDDDQPSDLLAPFGTVTSARVITDRVTNASRGFGFVEMSSSEEAQKACTELNGTSLQGRSLIVNEAKPQAPRNDRGGFGGGGGGGRY